MATIITKPADPVQPEPRVTVVPSVTSTATLGAPGSASATPPAGLGASAASPEPRVQSYLEEEHRWQPGDSFAAVSQKFYFTDKYAAALQEYNRDYPLAAAGMKQNPPAMVPGQAIWVPPVRILERDYARFVADFRPLNNRGMPAPVDSPSTSRLATDPKLCKVRDRGETLYDIARRTLGDSGQWSVIHRLNPTLSRDPKLPIPAGTVLRIPADAKMEAGDAP
jgi:nucleoid-associated protein YgaU